MPGALALDPGWLMTVLLLSLRLAGVFGMTPVLSAAGVPATIRVLLVLGLACALSLGLPGADHVAPAVRAGLGRLLQAGFTELALGATLALGVQLAFAAASMAGQVLGIQMGFGLAQVFDPASSRSTPILASALNQVAVLIFFLTDGHHALLRGFAYSLERFPLGEPWPLEAAAGPMLQQVGGLFGLGFALAAPVVFCLLLADLALGAVGRNLPQLNVLALGTPVKVVVGLVALALWSVGMGDALSRMYGSIYRTWDAIFSLAGTGAGPAGTHAAKLASALASSRRAA